MNKVFIYIIGLLIFGTILLLSGCTKQKIEERNLSKTGTDLQIYDSVDHSVNDYLQQKNTTKKQGLYDAVDSSVDQFLKKPNS